MKTNTNGNAYVRDCMLQALLTLMDEKAFQEISICDITRRANVSRMAYYRNYSSKEEILTSHLEGVLHQYVKFTRPKSTGKVHINKKNIAKLFEFCKEQQQFLQRCDNAGLGYYFLDAITAYLLRYFMREGDGKEREYILNAYASALCSTVVKWLRSGTVESAEQMAEMIYKIYSPYV